jgi:hypothetical protein
MSKIFSNLMPPKKVVYFLAAFLFFAAGIAASVVTTESEELTASSAVSSIVTAPPIDKGDFKVGFAPTNRGKQSVRELSADDRASLQSFADALNQTFALPRDVYITYDTCGEPNAFYNPFKYQVTVCHELYEVFDDLFKVNYRKQSARAKAVDDAIAFVFFHELGHALVHVYRLPIRGNEEDAVDQLSTLILTDGTEEGEEMAFNGALSFGLLSDPSEEELKYWDEHSLNSARFQNITCLIYGQNPQKYRYLVKNNSLPRQRAAQCEDEYRRVENRWTKLLSKHLKTQLRANSNL